MAKSTKRNIKKTIEYEIYEYFFGASKPEYDPIERFYHDMRDPIYEFWLFLKFIVVVACGFFLKVKR